MGADTWGNLNEINIGIVVLLFLLSSVSFGAISIFLKEWFSKKIKRG